jgi:hypothetical protein
MPSEAESITLSCCDCSSMLSSSSAEPMTMVTGRGLAGREFSRTTRYTFRRVWETTSALTGLPRVCTTAWNQERRVVRGREKSKMVS